MNKANQKGGAPNAATANKFWNVVTSNDTDSAEITLYGDVLDSLPRNWWTNEVIEGQYITPEGFMDDLAAVRGKSEVVIKLNSCGGDVYTGIAIHNALKGLSGHKTVIVEGIAASAASVIACAGDEVQVYPGSIMMIHGVSTMFADWMTLADLKKAVKSVDAVERSLAAIYSTKTGIEEEAVRNMMANELWMTGAQAIEKGFADTMLGDNGMTASLSADKKMLLVAGVRHDVHAFHNIPGNIPVAITGSDAEPVTAGNKNQNQEVIQMTEKELRAQYPELVAQIENAAMDRARPEAAAAERKRIQEIESIEAQIADKDLINAAKYGEHPQNAAQLAFEAMKKNAQLGQNFLQNLKSDADASGSAKVESVPNGGNSDKGEREAVKVMTNAFKAFSAMKGGK
ncbi:MAG TPA: Clp protease ClpP [Candidatus Coproplasma excrementipullorum]|nr:Clp protease ClpP [Candidatus Coproplasma excrementipullorum]